jgi:hypothetical protein
MQLGDRLRNFLKLALVLVLDITDFIILGKCFFFYGASATLRNLYSSSCWNHLPRGWCLTSCVKRE